MHDEARSNHWPPLRSSGIALRSCESRENPDLGKPASAL
jgi:hypothetical protein